MLVLAFFEYKHWISVNWTVAENQSNVIMRHVANRIAAVYISKTNSNGVHLMDPDTHNPICVEGLISPTALSV